MKIFFLLFTITIVVWIIGKKVFQSAKRNLLKDQAAWSGKDIKINYRNSTDIPAKEENDNILQIIADESKIYLDGQSKEEEEI